MEDRKDEYSLADIYSRWIREERDHDNFLIRNVGYITFLSLSKGKGKRRRKYPTEIEIIKYGNRIIVLTNGKLPNKKTRFDEIAEEIIGHHCPLDKKHTDYLLELLRDRERRKR